LPFSLFARLKVSPHLLDRGHVDLLSIQEFRNGQDLHFRIIPVPGVGVIKACLGT
jgi:hypothetical protein